MSFSDEQIERYARHIVLSQVGGEGQRKLLDARVLVVGAGGLGSPVILYLAAAGVGTIGIVDDDAVSLSNLQRQVIHRTTDIGRPKTESAREAIGVVNPDIRIKPHTFRLDAENAADLIGQYDAVSDGCDNFESRFVVADACFAKKVPLVSAALGPFDGQLAVWQGYEPEKPCYRCLFPDIPPPGTAQNCAEAGILGAVAGVMGTLQATEILKIILGLSFKSERLLIYNALETEFQSIGLTKRPDCPGCGSGSVA